MNTLREILDPAFLSRNSVYISLLVGFTCPLVGVYLVLRRLIFLGVALPQISSCGIAFAFALQGWGVIRHAHDSAEERAIAMLGSIVLTLAVILLLALLERRGRGAVEGRIGTAYVLAGGCGILLLVKNPIGEHGMLDLLRGEIISVSNTDVALTAGTFAVVVAGLFVFQKEFLLVSFDREMAITLKKRVLMWDGLLFTLIGLTVSVAVLSVGPLLTFGFLLLPPLIAHQFARTMRQFALGASVVGGVAALAGFWISYRGDLPVGPTDVTLLGIVYGASFLLRRIWSFARGRGTAALPGRWLRGFLIAVCMAPACSPGAARVVILTPHVDEIRHEFTRGFRQWHQEQFGEPAEAEWRNVGGTADALRFILSEFTRKPDGIGLDILFGGGQEPYLLLADKRLALRYQPLPDVLDGIPQNMQGMEVYDRDYQWFSAALSSFGILQNTRVQRLVGLKLVHEWQELAEPSRLGWVGVGDPRNSSTMNVMFEAFLQAYGWEKGWQKLTQIGGNARKFDRLSSSTAKDVTLGETAYAFAIDFYAFSQIAVAGRTNMTFALPRDFTAINADGICLLKGAPNLVTAQRFLDFVLGDAGQRLWFLPRGHPGGPQKFSIERMSIRPDFYKRYRGVSNIEFSPFDLKQSFVYDSKLGRDRREVLAALAGALMVDTHTELQAAWRSLIARQLPAAELAELGRMPFNGDEALRLARGPWKDPATRNRLKIEWQTWARAKYRKLCGS